MRGIQFEEEDNLPRYASRGGTEPFITRLVIRAGLAKNERQATYVLVALVIVFIIIAILVFPEKKQTQPLPGEAPPTAPDVTRR